MTDEPQNNQRSSNIHHTGYPKPDETCKIPSSQVTIRRMMMRDWLPPLHIQRMTRSYRRLNRSIQILKQVNCYSFPCWKCLAGQLPKGVAGLEQCSGEGGLEQRVRVAGLSCLSRSLS